MFKSIPITASITTLFFSAIILGFASCEKPSEDGENESTVNYATCGEKDPEVTIQDNNNTQLEFRGDILAEVLQDVDHIEISCSTPAFGYLENSKFLYLPNEDDLALNNNSIPVWRIPFVVNQPGINHQIKVSYYCKDYSSGSLVVALGFETVLNYNPGNLCDEGGVFNGDEFMAIDKDYKLNNVLNTVHNDLKITSTTFNIKLRTHPNYYFDTFSGNLFIFDISQLESAYVQITNGTNELTQPISFKWHTEPYLEGGTRYGDWAFLSSDIDITSLTSSLDPVLELPSYSAVKIGFTRCGGKKFEKWFNAEF